ncbi:MAG: GAF domain-containing protein, partial [Ardenticatenaceae bacterium]|nr:GAF domain-containing protein [Ardenticatenaceae bacterium]
HGLAGWVIRTQRPYVISDTCNDEHWLPRPGHVTTTEPWSVICTPFMSRKRAIGALTIHKPGASQFDDQDLSLLTAISNQAAITIENARLLEQSRRQLRVTDLLFEASKVINSSLDINEIMKLLLAQMNDLLNAEAISIALVDYQTNELVYRVAEGIGSDKIIGLSLPSNQGISGWVMEHNKALLVADAANDERFSVQADQRTGHPTRAMICAPIHSKGNVLGTVQAINPTKKTFTRQDLDLLVNLANIASSAIANAQQFARTQAAEARYTGLFQDSIDPILLTDLNGRIVEANERAFEFFSYTRNELLGKVIADLHPQDTQLPTAQNIKTNEVKHFFSQAVTSCKSFIHVEVYVKCTLFNDGELLQWIHHDISQQIELETMRDDLTAMLFHDLQSPLGNVISSLELMRYEVHDEIALSILDIATRSSHRLQTLIRSLLDINQLEAGHPVRTQEAVSVGSLFEYVWEVEQPNLQRRNIILNQEFAADTPQLLVDEDMIRRVLINLVDNAIKHSRTSQQITLSAKRENDKQLLICISDQGVGIPAEFRTKIFEKFQRVNKEGSSKGLGLGLAFCRLAVEAHGGRIWVDDAPGGGARFCFTLPITQV